MAPNRTYSVVIIVFLILSSLSPIFFLDHSVNADEEYDWEQADEKIIRLAPATVPQLPESIAKALTQRGCSIPQVGIIGDAMPEKIKAHNVISGEFQKPGQTDWAVLCSIDRRSAILIFWNGSIKYIEKIGVFSPDRYYLQGMGDGKIEYSHLISTVDIKFIIDHYESDDESELLTIEHQGIEDAFLGKTSGIHYWHQGKWLGLGGAD